MRRFAFVLFCSVFLGATVFADSQLERARVLYRETKYEESIRLLDENSNDPEIFLLLGENYYMLGENGNKGRYKKATEVLEKAVSRNPGNANYYLWLGRAYGRRAETSIVFKSPGYAKSARQCFEKAHELDPKSTEIMEALFEYYLGAPGFLGGGLDKAERMAGEIAALDAAEGESAHASIEEKRKNYSAAKEHWLNTLKLDPTNLDAQIEYAKFLRRRKEYGEAEAVLSGAEKKFPKSPALMFELARLYAEIGRQKDAQDILNKYLDPNLTPLTPDDPPREEAQKLLKKIS